MPPRCCNVRTSRCTLKKLAGSLEPGDTVSHALLGPVRYHLAQRVIRWQMKQLVQWNEGQAYTLDRATLIKMLDDALATARPRTE